jgi:hypothetical protein
MRAVLINTIISEEGVGERRVLRREGALPAARAQAGGWPELRPSTYIARLEHTLGPATSVVLFEKLAAPGAPEIYIPDYSQ